LKTETFIRYSNVLAASAAVLAVSTMPALSPAVAQTSAPIVQPGAPGQDTRDLSADEASRIADTRYTQDDVMFLQHMIPHHWQAVEMAALAEDRTNTQDILDAAGRITASQEDEIAFMQDWLRARGEMAPEPGEGMMDMPMEMMRAMGMATPDQMEQLAASEGSAFDRLFLELMIKHHRGAVTMVDDLLDQPGSAYDPILFDFVNDVTNDQTAEIERMSLILAGLSTDPRVGLSAGFRDAGEAISNLTLVASLPKPAGFFDPANPAGLPPKIEKADEEEVSEDEADRDDSEQSLAGTQWGTRSPLLSFSNTDMAFAGDKLVVGSYHGFNVYDLGEDGMPELYSSVVCPGGQGDVSVVGDLLIMSVEQTRGRVDCGLQGISEDVSEDRFRGLRIFDISDLARPVQVGQVQTCRGSHTHSVVSADDESIVVYNSGTAGVRDEEELEGCIGYVPGDQRTALFRIDVIEIPVDNPAASRIVDSPAVFADEETGNLAGLWLGGDHGDDTQYTSQTNQCHDITVFPSANLAAGACSGNGIIFDISDPLNPKRIDDVTDEGFAYWHSATFNNEGTKVLFTDEWGGGARARCRSYDPMDWGADAIYDIEDGQLEFKGYYKMPAPQSEEENCVAHNGSIIPVPGRDIFVQSWYQGGLSIVDFTDSANAQEIAFFDRGPIWDEKLVLGGYWSSYWYGDKIYATEIVRGLDVFSLEPSEYLSENEIAAAALADQGDVFNPQQQFPVTWPTVPVVARAYIDQLNRDEALSPELGTQLKEALDNADAALDAGEADVQIATSLAALGERLGSGDGMVGERKQALASTLAGIAAKLR